MKFLKLFSLFFMAVLLCSASPLPVTFVSDVYGQSANVPPDGDIWIGPYNLSFGSQSIVGTCIDYSIITPTVWDATLVFPSYYSTYTGGIVTLKELEEAEYLNLQFSGTLTNQQTLDLHESIWDVVAVSGLNANFGLFTESAPFEDPAIASLVHSAVINYGLVSPNSFSILESNPNGSSQDFLVNTPEPMTLAFVGAGLLALAYKRRLA